MFRDGVHMPQIAEQDSAPTIMNDLRMDYGAEIKFNQSQESPLESFLMIVMRVRTTAYDRLQSFNKILVCFFIRSHTCEQYYL